MSPAPWNIPEEKRPCTVHVRAQTCSMSKAAANELIFRLQKAKQVLMLSDMVNPLVNVYIVSNAERLRVLKEQLADNIIMTEVRMEIH